MARRDYAVNTDIGLPDHWTELLGTPAPTSRPPSIARRRTPETLSAILEIRQSLIAQEVFGPGRPFHLLDRSKELARAVKEIGRSLLAQTVFGPGRPAERADRQAEVARAAREIRQSLARQEHSARPAAETRPLKRYAAL